MMDSAIVHLEQLFIQAQNPATTQRASAELAQMEETDPDLFCLNLATLLQDDTKNQIVRQYAGLKLKNTLTSHSQELRIRKATRWISSSSTIRENIKNKVCQTLSSPSREVRNTASSVIAAIAAIELPNKEWPQLLPNLFNLARNTTISVQEASLQCLGYVFTDVEPSVLADYSDIVLNTIIPIFKSSTDLGVIEQATFTLFASLDCISKNFINEKQRDEIIKVIFTLFTYKEHSLTIKAYELITKMMGLYYPLMLPYMRTLFEITTSDITGNNDELIQLAIEFWTTVCDIELCIKNERKYHKSVIINPFELGILPPPSDGSNVQSLNLIGIVYNEIYNPLLSILSHKTTNYSNDEWNKFMASAFLLKEMSQLLEDQLFDKCIKVVDDFISSTQWEYRDAAVQIFGVIIDGPKKSKVKPKLNKHLPLLLKYLIEDPSPIVRETTSWSIQNICCVRSDVIYKQDQLLHNVLFSLYQAIHPANSLYVRKNACSSLAQLFKQAEKDKDTAANNFTPYFEPFFDRFFEIMLETEYNDKLFQLRLSALVAFVALIDTTAGGLQPTLLAKLELMLNQLLSKKPPPFQTISQFNAYYQDQADYLTIICSFARRLEVRISKEAPKIFALMYPLLKSDQSSIQLDLLLCLEAMIMSMQPLFIEHLPKFKDYLLLMLNKPPNEQILKQIIGLVSDIARGGDSLFRPFVPDFVPVFLDGLENNTFPQSTHADVFATLGDIVIATPQAYKDYLPRTIKLILFGLDAKPQANSEAIREYVDNLHVSILNCLCCIYQGLRTRSLTDLILADTHKILASISIFIGNSIVESNSFKQQYSISPLTTAPDSFQFSIDDLLTSLSASMILGLMDVLGDMIHSVGVKCPDAFLSNKVLITFIKAGTAFNKSNCLSDSDCHQIKQSAKRADKLLHSLTQPTRSKRN